MTIEANKRKSQRRILLSKITSREFEEMDENKDGKIDKCEFLVRQLVLQVSLAARSSKGYRLQDDEEYVKNMPRRVN